MFDLGRAIVQLVERQAPQPRRTPRRSAEVVPYAPRAVIIVTPEIRDALDHREVGARERQTLEAIAGILREARRSKGTSIEERTVIVLQSKRRRRRTSGTVAS